MRIITFIAVALPFAFSCSTQKLSSVSKGKSQAQKEAEAKRKATAGQKSFEQEATAPGAYIPTDGNSDRFKKGNGFGLLGCPVVPEDFNKKAVASVSLPKVYSSLGCSDCHGNNGEGKGQYPKLQAYNDVAKFIAAVRSGAPGMAPYNAAAVSDAELTNMHDALVTLDPGEAVLSQESVASLKPEELDKKYRSGLASWRKAGSVSGAACVNCHTFDGLDLAVIGYSDADIMRRAQVHTDVTHAKEIIEYVHVMREKHKVGTPCSPNWRPFQPGGEVLPGDTMEEQDIAFAEHMTKKGYFFMTKPVTDIATAKTLLNELNSMEIKKIKIGTPFPKWSHDPFHGPEEAGTHDWIPHDPQIPVDKEAAWAVADAYLEDPTDENLSKVFQHHFRLELEPPRMDFKNVGMEDTFDLKHQTQFLGQHYFRLALNNKPSWYDLKMDYMDRFEKMRNDPFWIFGNSTLRPCSAINDSNACPRETLHNVWPQEYVNDFSPMARNSDWPSTEEFRNSTHTWWTMSIFNAQSGYNMTYWQHRVGGHQFHRDFLNLMKELPVKLGINKNRTDGFPGYPAYSGKNAQEGIHPILDGANKGDLASSSGSVGRGDIGDPIAPYLTTTTHNTYAMLGRIALYHIERDPRVGNKEKAVKQYENWRDRVATAIEYYDELVAAASSPSLFVISKKNLEDTLAVLETLVTKAKAAKEVDE